MCRLKGLEVVVDTLGPDYHVLEVRRQAEWPRGPSQLRYLRGFGGTA